MTTQSTHSDNMSANSNHADNQFLLPDELGWECNDKISKLIDEWTEYIATFVKKYPESNYNFGLWQVAKAQLMDDMYAVIKQYQVSDMVATDKDTSNG